MRKTEERWAIVGWCGLYTGQELTRRSAIAAHVSWKYGEDSCFGKLTRWAHGALSDAQRAAWSVCKKDGDRAVKVSISYEAKP